MKSKDFPDCFHRTVVKGLFVKDSKILLAKEAPHLADKWELPGGGLSFGEDPHEGLKREIREEMNLHVTSVSKQPVYVWMDKFEGCKGMDWYYSVVLAYRIDLENLAFVPTKDIVAIDLFSPQELTKLGDDLYHQSHKLREVFDLADFTS